jgi:hypothetical protein
VIATDIAIEGIDPEGWRNSTRLLFPPSKTGGPTRKPGAPLLLFIENNVCVKAVRLGIGRIDPKELEWAGSFSLPKLRKAVGAPFAVAIEDDAIERIAKTIDGGVDAKDDLVAQWLDAARAVRSELGKGVHIDPDPVGRVPVPSFAAVQKTWEMLFPDDRAVALFIFDREDVWASYIVEKQGGDVVRVTTHAALGMQNPSLARHKEILAAIERNVARPYAGIFCSLDAWREIVGPDIGALARQAALRNAILDPAPPWLLALVGAGAMAGVAQEASRLFGRFVPDSIKATARAVSPFAALGFDPIDLFSKFKKSF